MMFFTLMISVFMVMITIHKDTSRPYKVYLKEYNCGVFVVTDEQEFYEKLYQIANLVVN